MFHGLRRFSGGSLDADQAQLKRQTGPTPDPDDVSHAAQTLRIHDVLQGFPQASKPEARAGDAEVPALGNAARPSDEGRRRRGAAPLLKLRQICHATLGGVGGSKADP